MPAARQEHQQRQPPAPAPAAQFAGQRPFPAWRLWASGSVGPLAAVVACPAAGRAGRQICAANRLPCATRRSTRSAPAESRRRSHRLLRGATPSRSVRWLLQCGGPHRLRRGRVEDKRSRPVTSIYSAFVITVSCCQFSQVTFPFRGSGGSVVPAGGMGSLGPRCRFTSTGGSKYASVGRQNGNWNPPPEKAVASYLILSLRCVGRTVNAVKAKGAAIVNTGPLTRAGLPHASICLSSSVSPRL